MLVTALVLQLLAQPQPQPPREIAVIVSRRIGPSVSEVRGQALARRVSDYLKAQGFDRITDPATAARALTVLGVKDSADCEGKRECVSGLGRVLRAWGVVSMDMADLDGMMAIHFEALRSDDGEQLAVLDVALPSKKVEAELEGKLAPLAEALRAAVESTSDLKAPPLDAPVATTLKPQQPAPPTPAVEPAPPMSKARVGALVTTGATVVAGALVILFVAQAGTAQRQLDDARVDRPNGALGYDLTEEQARALGGRVNDNYSAALGVGIGAAALAVVSAVLWAQP